VLAGALRNAGLSSTFVDVNLDFYGWLLADETLTGLEKVLSSGEVTVEAEEEHAQLLELLGCSEDARRISPHRTAALFALAASLGMSARPLLGPQRYLAGIDSSRVRMAELTSVEPQSPVAAFWHRWMDEHVAAIAAMHPRLVAMTVSHVGQLLPAAALAHRLRRLLPEATFLAGGPYCTTMASSDVDVSALFTAFDAVGLGPGDEVIVRAAQGPAELPLDMDGLWVRGAPRPSLGKPAPSSPDFSVIPLENYRSGDRLPLIPLEASRGCWARCRYCNYIGLNRGYRTKPIEQVMAEVLDVQARLPGAPISFVDDTIAPKRALLLAQSLTELSTRLASPVRWEGCMRPDSGLDLVQCQTLRDGGMHRVFIGFDAATEGMLLEIDKRATLADVRTLVRNLLAADIVVSGNFIVGLPGEVESDRRAVLELIDELGLDPNQVTASLFGLVRGSWYYAHLDEMGWPAEWVARVKENDVLTDFLPTPRLNPKKRLPVLRNRDASQELG
jgi:radical SAM superfamily enzyme YgiQ (UPF0313 family)